MIAKSLHESSIPALRSSLSGCLADSYKVTLAIVFTGVNHDIDAVRAIFNEFDIKVPNLDGLWDKVLVRHEELFGGETSNDEA